MPLLRLAYLPGGACDAPCVPHAARQAANSRWGARSSATTTWAAPGPAAPSLFTTPPAAVAGETRFYGRESDAAASGPQTAASNPHAANGWGQQKPPVVVFHATPPDETAGDRPAAGQAAGALRAEPLRTWRGGAVQLGGGPPSADAGRRSDDWVSDDCVIVEDGLAEGKKEEAAHTQKRRGEFTVDVSSIHAEVDASHDPRAAQQHQGNAPTAARAMGAFKRLRKGLAADVDAAPADAPADPAGAPAGANAVSLVVSPPRAAAPAAASGRQPRRGAISSAVVNGDAAHAAAKKPAPTLAAFLVRTSR